MTVSPRYDQYKDAWDTDVSVQVTVFCVCIILERNWNYSLLMIYIHVSFFCSSKLVIELKLCVSFIVIREELIVFLWITHFSLKRLYFYYLVFINVECL